MIFKEVIRELVKLQERIDNLATDTRSFRSSIRDSLDHADKLARAEYNKKHRLFQILMVFVDPLTGRPEHKYFSRRDFVSFWEERNVDHLEDFLNNTASGEIAYMNDALVVWVERVQDQYNVKRYKIQ